MRDGFLWSRILWHLRRVRGRPLTIGELAYVTRSRRLEVGAISERLRRAGLVEIVKCRGRVAVVLKGDS